MLTVAAVALNCVRRGTVSPSGATGIATDIEIYLSGLLRALRHSRSGPLSGYPYKQWPAACSCQVCWCQTSKYLKSGREGLRVGIFMIRTICFGEKSRIYSYFVDSVR